MIRLYPYQNSELGVYKVSNRGREKGLKIPMKVIPVGGPETILDYRFVDGSAHQTSFRSRLSEALKSLKRSTNIIPDSYVLSEIRMSDGCYVWNLIQFYKIVK